GRIAGIADRPVLDQALGVDQTVLEAEAIDEGLERRARRADRLREIDRAGARAFPETFADRHRLSAARRALSAFAPAPGRRHAGRSAAFSCAPSARPLAWRVRS